MTELTLKVNHAAKSVQTTGRVAVGEDVALNLVMDEEVADLAQLRVRLRFMGRDVAVFPFPGSGDEWTEGEAGENEYTYTGVINLNTVQFNALFAELGDGAVLTCAVVVDQVSNDDGTDDYNVLYGKGAIRVWNWNGDLHITPDVDEATAPVSLRECLDGKVDKVVTATDGNIAVFVNDESVQGGIKDANVSIDNGGAPVTSGASLPTVSKVGSIVSESLGPISTAIVGLQAAVQQKADATALSGKVDVEDGKELSSNDFTDALKAKLDGIESGAEKNVGVEFTQAEKDKLAGIEDEATKIVVDEEFNKQSGNAISNARVAAFHEGYHTFKNLVEGTYLPAKADLENGKVPADQLPSYVDDVLEYASLSAFPATGEAGKIYVALDTNKTYRWGGTGYVEISQSLALGETASTAYAGNKGKANADAIAAMKDGQSLDSFADVEGALAGKQATISDLADIRSGAAAGATAVQSVNGVTPTDGEVTITADDIPYGAGPSVAEQLDALGMGKQDALTDGQLQNIAAVPGKQDALTDEQLANIADVPYKANAAALRYALGETITASAQLADRCVNRVAPLATNTADIVLTFPASQTGARDFMALVTNTAGNTGNITFTPPTGATVYGDGFTHSPASGETWLYSVTEVAANVFWAKSAKMEVAQ